MLLWQLSFGFYIPLKEEAENATRDMRSTYPGSKFGAFSIIGEKMKIWKIESEEQFYDVIINCKKERLIAILDNKKKYYGEKIYLPKKNGYRIVYHINKKNDLYKIQKKLLENFLSNIMISDCACGFVEGTNYFDYMKPHTDFYKKNYYLRLDLENFFGNVSKDDVKQSLGYYVSKEVENRDEVLDTLIEILTYDNEIAQGAITSPIVSNIVFRNLDIRIQKYCFKHDIEYTRYADDLLFSGHRDVLHKKSFCKNIERIVGSKGFRINYSKTKRSRCYISLNGFVIDDSIRLSRKKMEEINRIIFFLSNKRNLKKIKEGNVTELNLHIKEEKKVDCDRFNGKYELINYLNGYRAFLISVVCNTENSKHIKKIQKIIARIEYIVKLISY